MCACSTSRWIAWSRRRGPRAPRRSGRRLCHLLRLLASGLKVSLQLGDLVLRCGQRVLLHEGELRDPKARFRVAREQLADMRVSVAIDRRQTGLHSRHGTEAARRLAAHPGDDILDEVAFLVGHCSVPDEPGGSPAARCTHDVVKRHRARKLNL